MAVKSSVGSDSGSTAPSGTRCEHRVLELLVREHDHLGDGVELATGAVLDPGDQLGQPLRHDVRRLPAVVGRRAARARRGTWNARVPATPRSSPTRPATSAVTSTTTQVRRGAGGAGAKYGCWAYGCWAYGCWAYGLLVGCWRRP